MIGSGQSEELIIHHKRMASQRNAFGSSNLYQKRFAAQKELVEIYFK